MIRLITTREGKFANIEDTKALLKDDAYVNDTLVPLLKVGRDKGESVTQIVRIIAGATIARADKGII